MEGTRRFAQALTNDLCDQNVKIKVKVKNLRGFDFDFKILTA